LAIYKTQGSAQGSEINREGVVQAIRKAKGP
jgi:hypothetical protein